MAKHFVKKRTYMSKVVFLIIDLSIRFIFTATGTYLPKADYDSEWTVIARGGPKWYLEFEHGLGTVPIIVDVQVEVNNYIIHAIGKHFFFILIHV